MMIWPLPGVSGSLLLRELRHLEAEASNICSHGSGGQHVDAYLAWVSGAVRRLRPLVAPGELRRLVVTETYWTVLTMANPSAAPPLMRALHDEIEARHHDLRAAVTAVASFVDSWSSAEGTALVVPDTNVLLHEDEELERISWHDIVGATAEGADVVRVVLPLLVVDELDDQKRDKVRDRARRTLRTIYMRFERDTGVTASLQEGSAQRGRVELRLLLDPPGHVRLARADDELVDRAAILQALLGKRVHFVTYDTGAALRATAAGLCTHRLEHGTGSA